jgi:hypothetical protein
MALFLPLAFGMRQQKGRQIVVEGLPSHPAADGSIHGIHKGVFVVNKIE